jgi:hypothetical protein
LIHASFGSREPTENSDRRAALVNAMPDCEDFFGFNVVGNRSLDQRGIAPSLFQILGGWTLY